jgi:riboflavin synthase
MFTGIVQEVGTVVGILPRQGGTRLSLRAPKTASAAAAGDSVCVSGACLTVTKVNGEVLEFDVGAETKGITTLGAVRTGQKLNLEAAVASGTPMGGHLVNGHVDGVGRAIGLRRQGETVYLSLLAPKEGARYLVPKGSIAVDGVSLTVVEVEGERVLVALIPYTLENTTLGSLRVGGKVNVEFDILAKYAQAAATGETRLTLETLEKEGFY